MPRYVDIECDAVTEAIGRIAFKSRNDIQEFLDNIPTANVLEVKNEYEKGDVCLYGFADENKSLAVVEIVDILDDDRGVAKIKFLKVIVDDTGNGLFNYLLKTGETMNASFKYLKNIMPLGVK